MDNLWLVTSYESWEFLHYVLSMPGAVMSAGTIRRGQHTSVSVPGWILGCSYLSMPREELNISAQMVSFSKFFTVFVLVTNCAIRIWTCCCLAENQQCRFWVKLKVNGNKKAELKNLWQGRNSLHIPSSRMGFPYNAKHLLTEAHRSKKIYQHSKQEVEKKSWTIRDKNNWEYTILTI